MLESGPGVNLEGLTAILLIMEKSPPKENTEPTLGAYLKTLRGSRGFSLREVEEATDVSNAYLSQLENEKISKPSPHILHKLAGFYGITYEVLMEKAGYIKREPVAERSGRVAASSLGTISRDEETALLEYLSFIRSQKRKKGG